MISTPVHVELPPRSADPSTSTSFAQATPFASTQPPSTPAQPADDPGASDVGLRNIPLDQIERNPHQPRQDFDQQSLAELASSIQTSGLMQPIVLRPLHNRAGAAFQIVAGERRWRAAQMIGLRAIPALVRDIDEQTAAELALVENLQREDLNAMERAEAFERLSREFNLTHAAIAQRVGMERSSISNHMRLLELDALTKQALRTGKLTMGHARALLTMTDIELRAKVARLALEESWSVRELEKQIHHHELAPAPGSSTAGTGSALTHARGASATSAASRAAGDGVVSGGDGAGYSGAHSGAGQPPHVADLERKLGQYLGTKVHLKTGKGKAAKSTGRLVIEFYNLDQFQGILEKLGFDIED